MAFCDVCKHRVCDMKQHLETEEHKRNLRRMIRMGLPPCSHCGGRFFYDEEDEEFRCINCARTPDSDNHDREAESLQSTVQQKCLHLCTESKSSGDKRGKIAQVPQVRAPTPVKPQVVPDKDWYAPREITFHSKHIVFLIKHLELLREGSYPPDPYHSGYTDELYPKKRKRAGHRAYFETPVTLAAEVERRLENCGLDGLLPQLLYTYNWTEKEVAKYYRISVDEVKFRARAVLWHISGWKYKARPYRRWIVCRSWKNQCEMERKLASIEGGGDHFNRRNTLPTSVVTHTLPSRKKAPARETPKLYEGHSFDGAWWPPKEITFRRSQMLWLIKNLPELREGHWPINPAGSGYVDMPRTKKGRGRRRRAYLEIPSTIAAEVEIRLERCGVDGLILEAIECWGESEQSLAKYLRIPPWSIKKRAKKALGYISGWKRKKQSYKEFISHRKEKRS